MSPLRWALRRFRARVSVPAATIRRHHPVLGGTMRRITITALLTAAALALAGCSGSGDDSRPEATTTATVTTTPKLSAAEERAACVDAWAVLLQGDADLGMEDAPAECGSVPEGDQLDAYMDGLAGRNQANRDAVGECVEDPACTSVPIP